MIKVKHTLKGSEKELRLCYTYNTIKQQGSIN